VCDARVGVFTNRGKVGLFEASFLAIRFGRRQRGLWSLLGLSDHEDTPHRRLLSGVGGVASHVGAALQI